MTDELHQRSLASQQFGRRAARALGQVAQLEVFIYILFECLSICFIIYYGLDAMHGSAGWLVDKDIKSYLKVGGVKLRDIILRCIQTDFKRKLNQQTETKTDRYYFAGKEAILAQDETTFLNSVSLLCEVFEHLRLADGTVINVLAVRNKFLADSFSCKAKVETVCIIF